MSENENTSGDDVAKKARKPRITKTAMPKSDAPVEVVAPQSPPPAANAPADASSHERQNGDDDNGGEGQDFRQNRHNNPNNNRRDRFQNRKDRFQSRDRQPRVEGEGNNSNYEERPAY